MSAPRRGRLAPSRGAARGCAGARAARSRRAGGGGHAVAAGRVVRHGIRVAELIGRAGAAEARVRRATRAGGAVRAADRAAPGRTVVGRVVGAVAGAVAGPGRRGHAGRAATHPAGPGAVARAGLTGLGGTALAAAHRLGATPEEASDEQAKREAATEDERRLAAGESLRVIDDVAGGVLSEIHRERVDALRAGLGKAGDLGAVLPHLVAGITDRLGDLLERLAGAIH